MGRLCFSLVFSSARCYAECVWCVRFTWIVKCYLLVCGRVRGPAVESALGEHLRSRGLSGGRAGVFHTEGAVGRVRLREWSDLSSVGRLASVALAKADRQVGAGAPSLHAVDFALETRSQEQAPGVEAVSLFVLLVQIVLDVSCHDLKLKCFHSKIWVYKA